MRVSRLNQTIFSISKRLITLAVLLSTGFIGFGQVGINTKSPDQSSVLDLNSTEHGLLVPRMSSLNRQSIANPARSLFVFDTDYRMFFYLDDSYSSGQWMGLGSWRLRDTRLGVKNGYFMKNLYLDANINQVSVGTAQPNSANSLTVVGNMMIGDSTSVAPTEGLAVVGQVETNSDVRVTGEASATVIEGAGTVPVGGIILWSGSPLSLPEEFVLCAGGVPVNGIEIPDLSDRFVVGYDASSSSTPTVAMSQEINYGDIGNTGGENTHVLTNDEMPKHTHSTNYKGAHTHEFVDDHANQNEKIELDNEEDRGLDNLVSQTSYTDYDGIHSHTISNDGSGVAHENRPSYYVLAFIIRVK